MDEEYLKKLEDFFENEVYKEIYLYLLKFFNKSETQKEDKDKITQFLVILNNHRKNLVFKEKDEVLEKSLNEIYLKSKLLASSNLKIEERPLFFRKQINDLILRELEKFLDLFNETDSSDLLSQLISFFFSNFQVNLTGYIPKISNLYMDEAISGINLKKLINPLFDKFPKETLMKLIDQIKKLNHEISFSLSAKYNQDIYLILREYSEIFPEFYYDQLKFFTEELGLKQNYNYSIDIAHIINNIVENRPGLFISKFFNLLNLIYSLNRSNNERILYLLEISLKTIYIQNSFGLFEHFKKELNGDFNFFFNLMTEESNPLNDILYEFYIEYLNYVKIYYYNGKITKELLEIYLKILIFVVNKGLSNEYLLLSLTAQLQLNEFHEKIKDLKKNLEKEELERYYQELIEQIRNYIEIIF